MKRSEKKFKSRRDLRIINRIMFTFMIIIFILIIASFIHLRKVNSENRFYSYDQDYYDAIKANTQRDILLFDDISELNQYLTKELHAFYNIHASYERVLKHESNLLATEGIVKERRNKAKEQKEHIIKTIEENANYHYTIPGEYDIKHKLNKYVYY